MFHSTILYYKHLAKIQKKLNEYESPVGGLDGDLTKLEVAKLMHMTAWWDDAKFVF